MNDEQFYSTCFRKIKKLKKCELSHTLPKKLVLANFLSQFGKFISLKKEKNFQQKGVAFCQVFTK